MLIEKGFDSLFCTLLLRVAVHHECFWADMVHMKSEILYFAVNTSEVSVLLDFNKSNPFQHRKKSKKIAKQIRTIYISKQQILTKRNNCWIVSPLIREKEMQYG